MATLTTYGLTCSWVYYSCEGKGDVKTGPSSYENQAVETATNLKKTIVGSGIMSERDGSVIASTSGMFFLGSIPSSGHNRTVEIGSGCKGKKIDIVATTSSGNTLSFVQVIQDGGKKNISDN